MSARVSGTHHDGTISVTMGCPNLDDGHQLCGAELEFERMPNGAWVLPYACWSCGERVVGALREQVIDEAERAIRNHEPSQSDYDAQHDQPSAVERQEIADRQSRELKR